ncbi:hypothetical protein [uncultured Tolumonas sp.]|uniref:hypothetical protein n=1 Tax=uncultured Tolumonas sp. TaxID=263765 RepID=UPI002A0A41C7|nr:hypothetical protein [uncultured Tolumonas sp.]
MLLMAKSFGIYVKWNEFFLKVALTLWLSLLFIMMAIQEWSGLSIPWPHQAAAVTLCLGLLSYSLMKCIQFCLSGLKFRFLEFVRVPLSLCFGLAGMNVIWDESKSIWPFISSIVLAVLIGYVIARRRKYETNK